LKASCRSARTRATFQPITVLAQDAKSCCTCRTARSRRRLGPMISCSQKEAVGRMFSRGFHHWEIRLCPIPVHSTTTGKVKLRHHRVSQFELRCILEGSSGERGSAPHELVATRRLNRRGAGGAAAEKLDYRKQPPCLRSITSSRAPGCALAGPPRRLPLRAPLGPPEPSAPPCLRHLLFPATAGDRQPCRPSAAVTGALFFASEGF